MNYIQPILDKIGSLLAGLHIDDHSALLIAIGVIGAFMLMGGHRHVRYHYNRFRSYYGEYRRRYRDW